MVLRGRLAVSVPAMHGLPTDLVLPTLIRRISFSCIWSGLVTKTFDICFSFMFGHSLHNHHVYIGDVVNLFACCYLEGLLRAP